MGGNFEEVFPYGGTPYDTLEDMILSILDRINPNHRGLQLRGRMIFTAYCWHIGGKEILKYSSIRNLTVQLCYNQFLTR